MILVYDGISKTLFDKRLPEPDSKACKLVKKRWEPCIDVEKQTVKHGMACYASDLHESRKWPILNLKRWRSGVGMDSFQKLFMEGYLYSSVLYQSPVHKQAALVTRTHLIAWLTN